MLTETPYQGSLLRLNDASNRTQLLNARVDRNRTTFYWDCEWKALERWGRRTLHLTFGDCCDCDKSEFPHHRLQKHIGIEHRKGWDTKNQRRLCEAKRNEIFNTWVRYGVPSKWGVPLTCLIPCQWILKEILNYLLELE